MILTRTTTRVSRSGIAPRVQVSKRWLESGPMIGRQLSLSRAARRRRWSSDRQRAGQAVVDQPHVIQAVEFDEGPHLYATLARGDHDTDRQPGGKHTAVA